MIGSMGAILLIELTSDSRMERNLLPPHTTSEKSTLKAADGILDGIHVTDRGTVTAMKKGSGLGVLCSPSQDCRWPLFHLNG
ncbi:hypothetical protein TNCV_3456861 [Trichonephila clavipes]|nr:hypothetical protein TNCV_3456861 [Trichonephila clavipes]